MADNTIKRTGKRTPFRSAAPRAKGARGAESLRADKPSAASAPATPAAADDARGEKIQKVLADAGVGSRRDMEAKIAEGRVTVNGEPAHIGQRVTPSDVIAFDGRIVRRTTAAEDSIPKILIYHKPTGEIVSRDDPEGRPTVFDHLPRTRGSRWINVGRLDFNTEGLLIFTTSGALANYLMHPRNEIQREYSVRVQGTLTPEAKSQLLKGVKLEDGVSKFATVTEGGGQGFNRWYNVTLSEGKNREVRRLFEAVGLPVSRLIRVEYGTLKLPKDLPRGKFRTLTEEQSRTWLESIGYPISTGAPIAGTSNPTGARSRGASARTGAPRGSGVGGRGAARKTPARSGVTRSRR